MEERKTRKKSVYEKPLLYILVLFLAFGTLIGVYFGTPDHSASVDPLPSAETDPDIGVPTLPAVEAMKIEDLVNEYYKAKLHLDADKLNEIVETDTPYDTADLAKDAQYVEKFANFRTYALPMDDKNFSVVYVTYDIYFKGIEVGAPALNRFLIHRISSKEFSIYDKKVSAAVERALSKTDDLTAIRKLKGQVEENLQKACRKSKDLQDLMDMLEGKSDSPAESESDESGSDENESDESENPAKEEPVENPSGGLVG